MSESQYIKVFKNGVALIPTLQYSYNIWQFVSMLAC